MLYARLRGGGNLDTNPARKRGGSILTRDKAIMLGHFTPATLSPSLGMLVTPKMRPRVFLCVVYGLYASP